MTQTADVPEDWHGIADLAQRFDRTEGEIEALVRRHHWTRVFRGSETIVGVDLDVMAQALGIDAPGIQGGLLSRS